MPPVERLHELFTVAPDGRLLRNEKLRRFAAGSEVGGKHGPYLRTVVDGSHILVHRIVWAMTHGEWPSMQIDHIDGNGLNNAPSNLRLASGPQNLWNRGAPRHNTSGYKGVSWHRKKRRWQARIQHEGKPVGLGYFMDIDAAHAAYAAAAHRLHGEFARPQ